MRAQIWGQAISGLGDDAVAGIRQYQQNKIVAGQQTAQFEGVVTANPEILPFLQSDNAPPEAQKAFLKLQKDGTLGVRDASLLAAFSTSFVKSKQEQQP